MHIYAPIMTSRLLCPRQMAWKQTLSVFLRKRIVLVALRLLGTVEKVDFNTIIGGSWKLQHF